MADAKMLLADTACPPPPGKPTSQLSWFVNFEASRYFQFNPLYIILSKFFHNIAPRLTLEKKKKEQEQKPIYNK